MSLHGCSAIVTGGAVGVGCALAAALARAGADVTVCDVRPEVTAASSVGSNGGGSVTGVIADVSDPAAVRRVVDGVLERHETIDVLINNAGVVRLTEPTDPWERALDDYEAVIGTNLYGAFLFGRAVAPVMAERGSGNIVNVSTDHVHHCGWPESLDHADAPGCPWASERRRPGFVGMDLYDASKWALNGLTQNWARSLRASGVRVNGLCLGSTDSHMLRSWVGFEGDEEPPAELLAKWMSADAVADVVVELIEEGPEGRSGDNVALLVGHPLRLPAPSPLLNLAPGFEPDEVAAPLAVYMSSGSVA
jgi:NAD(P)-dependent dehydrogenase (short-subunit alcohol dehydrogenase family)